MEFDSLKRMWIAGQQVEILPSAQRLFANRLRIPYSYLHRCPSWLQAESLNHFLTVEQKKRDTLYCRFDGNKLRAVFTERFTPIDNLDCLSKMLEYGFDPEAEVHCSLDPEMMVVNVPDNDRLFQLSEKTRSFPAFPSPTVRSGYWPCPLKPFITGWYVPTDLSPRPPWMPATSTFPARSSTSSLTFYRALSASRIGDVTGS